VDDAFAVLSHCPAPCVSHFLAESEVRELAAQSRDERLARRVQKRVQAHPVEAMKENEVNACVPRNIASMPARVAQSGDMLPPVDLVAKYKSCFAILRLTYSDFDAHSNSKRVEIFANAVHLGEGKYLLPRHMFRIQGRYFLDSECELTLLVYRSNGVNAAVVPHALRFERSKLHPLARDGTIADVVVFDAGMSCAVIPSMAKHFVRERDLEYLVRDQHVVIVAGEVAGGVLTPTTASSMAEANTETIAYYNSEQTQIVQQAFCGMRYRVPSQTGWCGAPVFHCNKYVNAKILGVHIYGDATKTNCGAVIVTREMFSEFVSSLPDMQLPVSTSSVDTTCFTQCAAHHLTYLGDVTAAEAPFVSSRTKLVPTPFCDEPILTEHSQKTPSMRRYEFDPLVTGFMGYGGDYVAPCAQQHRDFSLSYIRAVVPDSPASVLSPLQAINDDSLTNMNLHSSAGYPHCIHGKNKTHFIKRVDDSFQFADDTFERFERSYLSDNCEVLWVTAYKDELLKPNKLVRLLSVPPFEFTILCKQYFGAYVKNFFANWKRIGHCAGVDFESEDWNVLFQQLLKVSIFGFDSDCKFWDKLLPAFVMFDCASHIEDWYRANDPDWTPEHRVIRLKLVRSMIFGVTFLRSHLVQSWRGMFSGFWLTLLLNILANMYMKGVWFSVAAPLTIRDIAFVDGCFRSFFMGDDDINSVRPDLLPIFNRITKALFYRDTFGMVVTTVDKGVDMTAHDEVTALSFCKRTTYYEDGRYLPRLEMSSICGMLRYVRVTKHHTEEEQFAENAHTALRFLYFHGPEVYARFHEFLSKSGLVLPSYSYFHNLFCSGLFLFSF